MSCYRGNPAQLLSSALVLCHSLRLRGLQVTWIMNSIIQLCSSDIKRSIGAQRALKWLLVRCLNPWHSGWTLCAWSTLRGCCDVAAPKQLLLQERSIRPLLHRSEGPGNEQLRGSLDKFQNPRAFWGELCQLCGWDWPKACPASLG